ncbi:hypothetical protein WSM22_46020 [Cytophagales bacterium WSM2-2]|nr:hypothetical protein WSM22_46020 [Cytophagales bacterium WSM2-2]
MGMLSLLSLGAQAQYRKNDKLLNLGFGLNSYYNGGIPLSASFEVMLTDELSAGGGLDFVSYHYGYLGYNYGFTAFYLGGRVSYHFNKVFNINDRSWDIYGGASLGIRTVSWTDNFNNHPTGQYGSGLFLGIYAGARYYFSPKVGGFLELGALGSTNARLGVAFKF